MGLSVSGIEISLDSRDKNSSVNFVSHAHSDHTTGVNKTKPILASAITHDLIEARKGIKIKRCEELKNTQLLPSGHIIGSKQLYAETDNGYSVLYSGDFQTDTPILAEKIKTKQSDILIMDSTYPTPEVVFDDKQEVIEAINLYVNKKLEKGIILFGAYSLGKAQDIVKILNGIGIVPVVDKKISAINAIYKDHGIKLEYASFYENENVFEECTKGNFVGIVENNKLGNLSVSLSKVYSKRVFTAVASGFAKIFNMHVDVQFPLSDHADFKQAVSYINMCSPKLIYTFGPGANPSIFAKNLSKLGYNAHRFLNYKESLSESVLLKNKF
jgi:putative mRNA 3-end processing factor